MKRIVAFLLAGALALTLVACGSTPSSTAEQGSTSASEAQGSSEGTALSGKVTTGGSTSVESVIGILTEAFTEAQPDVDVTYDPTGSGAGITGASEGTLDIGLSSRALKEDEAETLDATVFALDGIAIVVNNENTVEDLSL